MIDRTEGEKSPNILQKSLADAEVRLWATSAATCMLVHELMQPLQTALNYVGVASKQLNKQEYSSELNAAVEGADAALIRVIEIVRRIRSFAVNGEVKTDVASLGDIVAKTCSQLSPESHASLELGLGIEPGADRVSVDRLLIELVFLNLLQNAADKAPTGAPVHVSITARIWGDRVLISLSDDGAGLTDETYDSLFVPLFTTKAHGSGLGLPLCKVIIEAHGCQLWAAAPSATGAAFYMTLPTPDPGSNRDGEQG
jgi:two-component system sensor kinase FixL